MERLKIIKELNNVANILEENGRISEASQITNVMTRIAQGAAPTGNAGAVNTFAGTGTTAGNLTNAELQKKAIDWNKYYIKEMLKLRDIAQPFLNDGLKTEYTYDKRGYVIKIDEEFFIQPTIQQLVDEINQKKNKNIKVPEAPTDNKYIEEIAKNIDSAADWPDPEGEPSITKAINENYLLGYNLLGGTYYIQNKKNPSDVADERDINKLREVFTRLGSHYKKNNSFPSHIMSMQFGEHTKDDAIFMDPNIAILEALEKGVGKKWKYLKDKYSKYYNFETMKLGFVQEYNRRYPANQISLDDPQSLNEA
jgi:hypothetical protein